MQKSTGCGSELARWDLDHRANPIVCALSLGLCALPFWSQALAEEFFMEKKSVDLAPSTRFETITFYETDSAGNPRALLLPARAAPLSVPARIGLVAVEPYLDQYGIVLVRMVAGVDRADLDAVVESYNRSSVVAGRARAFTGREARGNPIYESGSVDRLVINEVFVRFKPGIDLPVAESFLRSRGAEILTAPENIESDSFLVRFPGNSGHAARALSNRMDMADEVAFAQPNFIVIDHRRLPGGLAAAGCSLRCPADVPPRPGGDPYLTKQWHLNNTGAVGTRYADINAFNAWRVTEGDPAVVVAILDDAIETTHEDLGDQFEGAWSAFQVNRSNDCSSVVPSAHNVHGTAVAGLVGAVARNDKGVRGVAPLVKLLAVRSHCGSASPVGVVKNAITYAAQHAQILSMSWSLGSPTYNEPELTSTIRDIVNSGRLLVIAADNEGGVIEGVAYPASLAATMPLIAVSATDTSDALQETSDSCAWTTNNSRETVSAPGVLLYTTDLMGEKGYCTTGNNSNYVIFDGTSGSTPIVAGVAALMLSKNIAFTPTEIRDKLRETAKHPNKPERPDDDSGWGVGWGRVDACRALEGAWCFRSLPAPSGFRLRRPVSIQ